MDWQSRIQFQETRQTMYAYFWDRTLVDDFRTFTLVGSASRPFQRSDGIRMLICSSAIGNGRVAARSDQDRALQMPYPSTFHLSRRQASRSISVFYPNGFVSRRDPSLIPI